MPECNPVIPAQPNEARYGIDKLHTSRRLTRAIYKELYGEEAPAYDPKRRIKRWFFTDRVSGNPDTNLLSVTVWDATTRTIREMGMKESEVCTPNLPGSVVWPKYVNPVATMAVIVDPDGERLPLNGETLADPALAKSVVDEINAQCGTDFALVACEDPWPWKIVWGLELRRRMNISNSAGGFDAAAIVRNRYAKGVGAPGKWSLGPDGGPVFSADVPIDGEQDARPEVPMPCRPLLPNERFESGFAGLITIVRTDLTTDEPAPGTGGLTAEQDKLLRDIAKALGVK